MLYHERAAEKASENFANRAVIAHCRQALTIADRLGAAVPAERRRALEERRGLASFHVSEFTASGEAFARAAERSAEPTQRGVNLFFAGFSHLWAHDYERSRAAREEATELARQGCRSWAGWRSASLDLGLCTGDPWRTAPDERGARTIERTRDEAALGPCASAWRKRRSGRATAGGRSLGEQAIAAGGNPARALVIWPGWFLGKRRAASGAPGHPAAHGGSRGGTTTSAIRRGRVGC
jgi:hypothetical protein